ncbi:maleylpyruvate isomerase family mycothiol-dependent enzyme [Lentzea tibetensis]|uniref:Maleylpyruvate isomerase family mycothiol-dependent enzyme n=1 Tax=Lentzea tibetensis TaxID=2591470 RepID=A0A563ELR1_9PSEU|nr:maleylpyruvate isomerase family mycothiol-dependent enzyme [Lentzea tibetensis]TWP48029.1 maleylpyruvate isomerase family mycothiol-dependent enzyme [Lentzea tibetensis]
MSEWDPTSADGKGTILRVVREEANRMFDLAEPTEAWKAPTACAGWSTADVIGHIVDTTEGYFEAFDAARRGEAREAYGTAGMGARANEQALAFRNLSQHEMMDRIRADFDRMMSTLDSLSDDEWENFVVTHFYMGPVPAWFYAAGQLMDYGVHSWDIRQGSGRAHGLSGDVADLLAPLMFLLWQSTVRSDVDRSPFELGITVSGRNAAGYRINVDADGMRYAQGAVDDLPAVIDFDAGSLVLTAFGRCNAGTVRGDAAVADRFLNLFYRI